MLWFCYVLVLTIAVRICVTVFELFFSQCADVSVI